MSDDLDDALNPTATEIAKKIYSWAESAGALLQSQSRGELPTDLSEQLGLPKNSVVRHCGQTLQYLRIVGVTADDNEKRVAVLVKNQVSNASLTKLPGKIGDVAIRYIGQASLGSLPPHIPQASALGGSRFFLDQHRFCCGSSITVSPVAGAGTLGALIRLADGTLCGLTNNHVTGDCNHSRPRMHILCPAPMDADPDLPAPTGIGTHRSFVKLESGDPNQVSKQELDAAIFNISNSDVLSSYQGPRFYDTPAATANPFAGMRVKKVGRTTGLTFGTVLGPFVSPFSLPYASNHFRSTVHFANIWAIAPQPGDTFSQGGDSGSLVVTDDGSSAVGLLFAGGEQVSFIMPIDRVLSEFNATLVSGLNV
jgi:hypothetical protein